MKSVEFLSVELGESQNQRIISTPKNIDSYKHNFKGKWIFDFQEKTKYSEASLEAFYFIEEFITKPIADDYARLIQYSDWMIEHTAQFFFDGAKETGVRYLDTLPNKAKKFEQYVADLLKKPTFDYLKFSNDIEFKGKIKKKGEKQTARKELVEKEYESYLKQSEKWESMRLSRIDSLKKSDSNFVPMLYNAFAEAKINKLSDTEFEE